MISSKINLLAKDCTRAGNIFYFIAMELNLLFSYDLDRDELTLIDTIPEPYAIKRETAGCILAVGDELYIGPCVTQNIWIYNLGSGKWKSIERQDISHRFNGAMLQAFEYDRAVYFVGSSFPAIIRINPESKELYYIEKPFLARKDYLDWNDAFFRAQYVIKDDLLYLPCCYDNTVLQLNLKTEAFEWIHVGDSTNRFGGIAYDGRNFWLSPRCNSPIVEWDGENQFEQYALPAGFDNSNMNYFLGCLYYDDHVICCNMLESNSISLALNGNMEHVGNCYSLAKKIDDTIVFQETDGYFHILKGPKEIEARLTIELEKVIDFYINHGKKFDPAATVIAEGRLLSLSSFLACV